MTVHTLLLGWSKGLVGCLLLLAPLAAMGEATLEAADSFPEGLPASLQGHLTSPGYRVVQDGAVLAELWLAGDLPEEGGNEGALGIEFGFVTSSGMLGVVHFPELWIDYRETEVRPGSYTMRYWVQPADGDHMGVSEYRDFLLLNLVTDDADPAALYEKEPLLELVQNASEQVHPAVVAIFPVWDEPAEAAELVMNDLDQLTLAVRVGDRVLGLVLEGYGDLP